MSDVKWIKVATDIFDNRKIRQIETMPEGDAIIVIWFKLLCLAGNINDNGNIYLTEEVPYTEQMLSIQFNRPLTTVQLALRILEQFQMIKIIDDILLISNWEKYQSIEKLEKIREQTRKRVQKYRKKQDLIECNVTCNANVTQCNATDKEEDKEIDKEKEIELEEENNNMTISKDIVCQTKNVRLVIDAWNDLEIYGIKPISKISNTSKRYKMLQARLREYGEQEVINAIDKIRQSKFLQGKNDKGWMITFDWFVAPNNFPKVLEGNYDNKSADDEEQESAWAKAWREA